MQAFLAHWNFKNEISWASATLDINNEYKWLKGTLVRLSYPPYTRTTDYKVTVYFYGDGDLLTTYQMMPGNNPFDIEVNIEGVKHLKILFKDDLAVRGARLFGLTDSYLTNISKIDAELIERVKLYTSDEGEQFYSQLDKILELPKTHNLSNQTMALILSDYFKKYGFTDIKEANSYWNDAKKATRGYQFLINDDCYMAYALTEWLNKTTTGMATRGLLITDGWLFNNELTQYVNLSTYITEETKSIKNYKTMLLKFMGDQEQSIAAYKYGKNIQKILKESVKYTDKTFIEIYSKKIDKCKTLTEKTEVFNEYCDKMTEVYFYKNEKFELHLEDYKEVSDALGTIGKAITVESEVFSDFAELAMAETKAEMIDNYAEFLQYIIDGKEFLPAGLVIAAEQLQNETITPYKEGIMTILGQLSDHVANDMYDLSGYMTEKIGDRLAKVLQDKPGFNGHLHLGSID